MSQQPPDGKIDFSNLPRGAIGIKGFPVSRNTRLPSIRSPRDLTLGAKRSFVPNIPVRREKRPVVPDKESPKAESTTGNSRRSAQRHERGRGRGRGRGQLVQLKGSVFGDGIAASTQPIKEKHRESTQRSAHAGSSSSVRIKQENSEDKSLDLSDILSTLLRDDFIDEDTDDTETKPIVFPLPKAFGAKEEKMKEKPAFSNGTVNNYDEIAKFIKKEFPSPEKKEDYTEKSLPDLLSSSEPVLMLLQFPSCVAVPQKNEEPEKYSTKNPRTNAENNASIEQKTNSNGTSLSNLSEGYIGKLQIMKSGKTKLILGSLVLNVEKAMPLRTKHEVASVRTNVNGGDMTILGHVHQKLKCMPNIDNLLS